MSEKARTFKQLEKEKSFEEFNRFAKAVTEAYANSTTEYSQTSAAMDNHVTKKAFRKLMDYAIVTALVSIETAENVLNKAKYNQQRKTQEAGANSIIHHKELMKKRVDYLVGGYLDAEINRIATDIADNHLYSIGHFCKKYDIESEILAKRLLERAIVENIVSDDIMEKLIERSLKANNNAHVQNYFQNLRNQRENNKNSQ